MQAKINELHLQELEARASQLASEIVKLNELLFTRLVEIEKLTSTISQLENEILKLRMLEPQLIE
jgi:hypothetical protein